MTSSREWLERALDPAEELHRRRRDEPIRYIRWLPLQWEFLADPAPIKQIRSGEQTIGKTTATCALIVEACLGRHPLGADGYPVPPPPVEWWLVCASWGQSLIVQAKLWALLPKEELDPSVRWSRANGFTPTKRPIVTFRNGSTIVIKTTGQEEIDFASATVNGGIAFDEPPKAPGILQEAMKRVERSGGRIVLSYTPINAPTEYLRVLTEEGQVADHWRPLTPRELIPVGAREPLRTDDGRPMDAAWIAHLERTTAAAEVPVRVHGEWEFRTADRYFTCFRDGGQDSHVHTRAPTVEVDLVLGIDHGSRPGKQIAVLSAVWRENMPQPNGEIKRFTRVYVLAEYTDPSGVATPDDDAAGILAMLAEFGWSWSDLAFVGGDRVHMPGTGSQKSNRDLAACLARRLRLPPGTLSPPILTIKRGQAHGAGSVGTRARWLFHRIVEGGVGVHPRCKRVREALARTDLSDNDHKDPFDGLVYGLDREIFPRMQVTASVRMG